MQQNECKLTLGSQRGRPLRRIAN